MPPGVEIEVVGASRIPELRTVFLALHDHHRRHAPVPLSEPDDVAWRARAATYAQYFAEGRAVVHVARVEDRIVGYAVIVLHDGSDDTFPLAAGYAEVYTLAVLPECRGGGIGTRLLDAADVDLERRGIRHLTVAVMVGNDAAIRLYRRRGLVPAELVMYRIGQAPPERA